MTKRELSQLYYLKCEIEQQKRRLAELEAAAQGMTANITGMPHGSETGDPVARHVAEIADLKALIELNIQKCWYELNRLNRYIASIDDSFIRQILSLRYINGLPWNQVALSIGGGNTADGVRKAHDRFIYKK